MSKTPINPDETGKYNIPGEGKNLELIIEESDFKDKYLVESMTGIDKNSKIPSTPPPSAPGPVNWFACFAIYHKKDGKENGVANVSYSFTLNMDDIEKLYVGLGGSNGYAKDVTEEIKKDKKVKLKDGDPPIGRYP